MLLSKVLLQSSVLPWAVLASCNPPILHQVKIESESCVKPSVYLDVSSHSISRQGNATAYHTGLFWDKEERVFTTFNYHEQSAESLHGVYKRSLDTDHKSGPSRSDTEFSRDSDTESDLIYPVFDQPPYLLYLEGLEEAKWADDLEWEGLMIEEELERKSSDSTVFEDPEDLGRSWNDPYKLLVLEKAYNIVFSDDDTDVAENTSENVSSQTDNKTGLLGNSDLPETDKISGLHHTDEGEMKNENVTVYIANNTLAPIRPNLGLKEDHLSASISDGDRSVFNASIENNGEHGRTDITSTLGAKEMTNQASGFDYGSGNIEARNPYHEELHQLYEDDDDMPNLEPTDLEADMIPDTTSSSTLVASTVGVSKESSMLDSERVFSGYSVWASAFTAMLGSSLDQVQSGTRSGTHTGATPVTKGIDFETNSRSVDSGMRLGTQRGDENDQDKGDFPSVGTVPWTVGSHYPAVCPTRLESMEANMRESDEPLVSLQATNRVQMAVPEAHDACLEVSYPLCGARSSARNAVLQNTKSRFDHSKGKEYVTCTHKASQNADDFACEFTQKAKHDNTSTLGGLRLLSSKEYRPRFQGIKVHSPFSFDPNLPTVFYSWLCTTNNARCHIYEGGAYGQSTNIQRIGRILSWTLANILLLV